MNDAVRARKVAKPAGRRAFAKFSRANRTPKEDIGNDDLWIESRANTTLEALNEDMSTTSSDEFADIPHNKFYSGSEHSDHSSKTQRGSGNLSKKDM